MSHWALLLLTIAALGLVSPAPIQAWQLGNSGLESIVIPAALRLISSETSADLDSAGLPEAVELKQGVATIKTGIQIRWQSPAAWHVVQARITDLNRDGLSEVTLLVWRPFKPWPVDAWLPNGGRIADFHDSSGMSCHIILIGWKQGSFRELWAGSAMADPVKSFMVADLTGTGLHYLVSLEGQYDDPPSAPARRLKVWEWNGFGFTNVNELEESFSLMGIAEMNDRQILILSP